jgi:anti-sigma-K factor RskA
MSDDPTIDAPDGNQMLAAEYVLGVLGAEERREVERRLAQEPALAREVAFWEERLGGLADAVAPVPPPPQLWARINAVVSVPPPPVARPRAARPSLWQSLEFWRAFGIGAGALATASIAGLTYLGVGLSVAPTPTRAPPLMATLGGAAGQPNFVAAITATGDGLVVVPAALLTTDPRAFELWLIPVGETTPRSLGLIEPGQPIKLIIPPDLAARLTPDATLAVSLEPPGGSPTGAPTGPVIAVGKLTSL